MNFILILCKSSGISLFSSTNQINNTANIFIQFLDYYYYYYYYYRYFNDINVLQIKILYLEKLNCQYIENSRYFVRRAQCKCPELQEFLSSKSTFSIFIWSLGNLIVLNLAFYEFICGFSNMRILRNSPFLWRTETFVKLSFTRQNRKGLLTRFY